MNITSWCIEPAQEDGMKLYKNWPQICQVGYHDKDAMLVLAFSSDKADDFITSRLRAGFPECFSLTPIGGPFPLSVIRQLAYEEGKKQGVANGADYPDAFDVLHGLDVPIILLEVATEEEQESDWPLYPPELAKGLKQGDTIEWKEKKMVILEHCQPTERQTGRLCVAPAECIALDL